MRRTTPGRALILGLGRFGGGREAARFLLRRGWQLRIADRASAEQLADERDALVAAEAGEPIDWQLGSEAETLLDDVHLVVVNPAVPPGHPLLTVAAAAGIPVTQEVNLLLEAFPGRVVLVTGTDGKSTTTTLLAAALAATGRDVLAGGNLGHSLLADERRWSTGAIAVLEISSFQLERLDPRRHRVHGAVLTAVTADHLDRHGSIDAYHRAKSIAAAVADEFLVHLADDPIACAFASPARRRITCASRPPEPGHVGSADGWVLSGLRDRGPVLHAAALELPGAFQIENAMLAYAAAAQLDADRHRVGLALAQQRPLPYRLQRLLTRGEIEIFDNSVSTHLPSTLSALDALPSPVHWVGGGKTKDGDYDTVARAIGQHPHVGSAHLFGAAATPLAARLRSHCPVTSHERLEEALDAAWRRAQPGDRVLFSPAFASFDQFPNFRARAAAFHAWAARLREAKPAGHAAEDQAGR